MVELVACPYPSCGLPADIVQRDNLESTSGPVEHVRIFCLNKHTFWMPSDALVSL